MMRTCLILSTFFLMLVWPLVVCAQDGKHLFILSGQSNMVGLKPEESFLPQLEAKFGKGNILIAKDAMGSQPIRRWYKN